MAKVAQGSADGNVHWAVVMQPSAQQSHLIVPDIHRARGLHFMSWFRPVTGSQAALFVHAILCPRHCPLHCHITDTLGQWQSHSIISAGQQSNEMAQSCVDPPGGLPVMCLFLCRNKPAVSHRRSPDLG